MINDYFLFAFRNIKRKGVRSYLTLIGIFIGIMAVVSLISLGGAMKSAVTSQFGMGSTEVISVQAGGLQYGPPGSSVVKPLTTKDVDAIDKIDSVEFALGRNIETVSVEYNDKLEILPAYSLGEDSLKKFYSIIDDVEIDRGNLLNKEDSGKIFLGYKFLDGSTNGFSKDILPGKKMLISGTEFEVSGIIKKKGSFIYDKAIFMLDGDLKKIEKYGENVDMIEVKVKSKDLIEKTKGEIERILRQRRNVDKGEEDFAVSTPEGTLATVNQVLGAIQIFIIIIASISIIVGAIGIINTMTTSVLERKKEIGIMKSIGSRNSQIFMQFFIESGFLGLLGGAVGILLGISIGYIGTFAINNWIGSTVAPIINFSLIFFSLMGSFLIGAVAGIIPAMKAAKLNPVEALRG